MNPRCNNNPYCRKLCNNCWNILLDKYDEFSELLSRSKRITELEKRIDELTNRIDELTNK